MTQTPTGAPTVAPTASKVDRIAVKKKAAVVRAKKLRVAKQMHKIPNKMKEEGLYVKKQTFTAGAKGECFRTFELKLVLISRCHHQIVAKTQFCKLETKQ
jgi:hypothetical protein